MNMIPPLAQLTGTKSPTQPTGNTQSVAQLYQQIQSVNPNDLSAKYLQYEKIETKSDAIVDQAIVNLKKLAGRYDAIKGDKDALFVLAELHWTGKYANKSSLTATNYLRLAHEQGHPLAALFLTGIYLEAGNQQKAEQYWNEAPPDSLTTLQEMMNETEPGSIPCYFAGLLFAFEAERQKKSNPELSEQHQLQAEQYFGKMNALNNSVLSYRMGMKYFKGEGVKPDMDIAIKHLKNAHLSCPPHPDAAHQLGDIYFFQNELDKALEYYQIADQMKHINAKTSIKTTAYMLGLSYENTDEEHATRMFRIAAKAGDNVSAQKVKEYESRNSISLSKLLDWLNPSSESSMNMK